VNYDQRRQIVDGPHAGRWHYTTANRRTGTHPIGYCADHDPHETEEDARWCYTRYLHDRLTIHKAASTWTDCDAEGCDQPAHDIAQTGPWRIAVLCPAHIDDHTTVLHTLRLDRPAGDSMHS